jgi:hypothetical protein
MDDPYANMTKEEVVGLLKAANVRFDLERQALLRVAEHAVMAAIKTLKKAGEWSVHGESRVDGLRHMEGVLTDLHALDRPIGAGSCEGDGRSPNCCADFDRLGPLRDAWGTLRNSRYERLHALAVEAYMLMGLISC